MPEFDNNSDITKDLHSQHTPIFIFQILFDNEIFKLIHEEINMYLKEQILQRRKKAP
jgi:hypothetical protein